MSSGGDDDCEGMEDWEIESEKQWENMTPEQYIDSLDVPDWQKELMKKRIDERYDPED